MPENRYTIIDLGSNSFHMLTVLKTDNGFSVFSKSKKKVRLATGLDAKQNLSTETMVSGWSCLQQFRDELDQIKPCKILVTATAALRIAKNRQIFIKKAETILQHPIKLISGIEEATTIYRGVTYTEKITKKMLIIDIGGASTELIIGKGNDILLAKSLNMGCVTWLNQYFADGNLNSNNFNNAVYMAKKVIAPQVKNYIEQGWSITMGASGTIQAVREINNKQQINKELTLDLLNKMKKMCIGCENIHALSIDGLKKSRIPVFASGLAILIALFESLNIKSLTPSKGALREGLISTLLENTSPSS
ncbi:guanosine pentaphosphatase [Psychromonas antarctica]|jgi:exopolyphosphatase/guanosine-5'-triphosphate,3'-diphosphate pyrophosphatase|uniref:Ppx/GppA phosphatase family protein n=1 Tax=Psychromonas antarctica TaxID=67573 RepID=UPI001EE7CFBC|nr:guanosine pentaphosphatase [Psychromonas antarctica]MCG6202241.1 guanosine pentaphosphatase [Psychromonas antarctica]